MNIYLLMKYYKILAVYPELCFKFILKDKNNGIKNKFILGVITSDGPVCYGLDNSLWDKFDVRILNPNHEFSSYIKGDEHTLDNLDLKDVSYFDTNGEKLRYYFGRKEEVVVPDEIKIIGRHAFAFNNYIKSVKGNNVIDIYKNAFYSNEKLEKLDFKKLEYLTEVSKVPSLREIKIGNELKLFNLYLPNFDIDFIVSEEENEFRYKYDKNLEEIFLHEISGEKIDNAENCTEINVIRINGNDRRYRIKREDKRNKIQDKLTTACIFEKLYKQLPDSIKTILENLGYTYYLTENFDYPGACLKEYNIILYDFNYIKYCFFHEIAHALDCYYNISIKEKFNKIFYEEREFLYKTISLKRINSENIKYFISSSEEYFAECFQRYMEKDECFYKECPKTYEYIENFIKDLNANQDLDSSFTLTLQ